MKMYWIYYVFREGNNIRFGHLGSYGSYIGSYGSYTTLDKALEHVERLCEKYDIVLAWINEVDENNDQRTVWSGLCKRGEKL